MTRLEAMRLLHPDSRDRAVMEIKERYEDPVTGMIAVKRAIDEAIDIACQCINKVELMEDDGK